MYLSSESDDFFAFAGACDRNYHKKCTNSDEKKWIVVPVESKTSNIRFVAITCPPVRLPNSGDSHKIHSAHQQPLKCISIRMAIILIMLLTILFGVLIFTFITLFKPSSSPNKIIRDGDDVRKNIPINSTIGTGRDSIGAGKALRIVPRDSWLAQPPSLKPVPLNLPVSRVVVIPTQTEDCKTQAACTFRVRYIQTFNIESSQYDDIIYNFLIGGDGNVYEGRGWDREGAHLKGYNDYSISLAFIGTFERQQPSAKQMNVARLLIDEGVNLGKLTQNYKIVAANLIEPTSRLTSATALYESFKNYPQWSEQL